MKHDIVPVKRDKLNECEILENAFIVIEDEVISAIGTNDYSKYQDASTKLYDANNKIVIPGLVDAHTHLVFGGSREHEYRLKLEGVEYLEILRQGGGILNTVQATRKASFEQLYEKAYGFANSMLSYGVTTVEAKSGYGLNLETEIKQLEVAHKVEENHPIDIIHTAMPAHAIPTEHKANPQEYIDEICNVILPGIAKTNLAKYVDIFCEDSCFNLEQSRMILSKAKELGFKVKIHADEVVSMGGARLAGEIGAISAEHLMATSLDDMDVMAKHNVIANLLPATTFNLGKDYAKARDMIDKGIAVVVCSDFNPGSCPNENLQLTLQIASRGYRMTPIEVYTSATINAACALELQDKVGSIEVGKQADIVVMDANNLEYTIYHFGINHVKDVFKKGKLVVENKNIV